LLPNGKIREVTVTGEVRERLPKFHEALQTFMGATKKGKAPNVRILGDGMIKIAGNAAFPPTQAREAVVSQQ
jgi:hypothetical protein